MEHDTNVLLATYLQISLLSITFLVGAQALLFFANKFVHKRSNAIFGTASLASLLCITYTSHKLGYWFFGLAPFFSCNAIKVCCCLCRYVCR